MNPGVETTDAEWIIRWRSDAERSFFWSARGWTLDRSRVVLDPIVLEQKVCLSIAVIRTFTDSLISRRIWWSASPTPFIKGEGCHELTDRLSCIYVSCYVNSHWWWPLANIRSYIKTRRKLTDPFRCWLVRWNETDNHTVIVLYILVLCFILCNIRL